ncbi:DUF1415 domain-containing protein [Zhongshania guokunii]|uniref:DUF1415 domain-containing protein n=1 Tax=Zhongshania guokunii TaxID=641783 RepID=A0ABV3U4V6_9GAMM
MSTINGEKASIEIVEGGVRAWLEQVVVGLGLCPFAAKPLLEARVRIDVSLAQNLEELAGDLHLGLCRLEETPAAELETSLLVVPNMLADFYDYNDFLDIADAMVEEGDWEGVIQIASFHPQYQFAGTELSDAENFTNRAPYPIFHLLREASLEAVLAVYPDPEAIPERNIQLFQNMDKAAIKALFPYCFR